MVIQTAEVEGTVEKPPVWDEHKSHRREMTLSNTNRNDDEEESEALQIISTVSNDTVISNSEGGQLKTIICPSCGHTIKLQGQGSLQNWPGLPAGVKFDPYDQEILQHLEAKVMSDNQKLHPLIDEFIPTIDGQNGICYTHPEKLPGVNKDGLVRHFFHRPSKAYTTGTRKRRKVHTDADGGETRWHKTGKTRPISGSRNLKGYKKILVLYTNYGRQRKPEKTNWVMHQYHLGNNEEEKDGELVVSKVFYQTQPRQCGSSSLKPNTSVELSPFAKNARNLVEYYNPHQFVSYDNVGGHNLMTGDGSPTLIPNLVVHGDGSSFIHLPSSASKGK